MCLSGGKSVLGRGNTKAKGWEMNLARAFRLPYLRKMLASRVRTWLAIQLKWPPCHSPSSQPSLRLYVAFNTTGYFSGLCVTFYSSIYLFMSFLASLFPRMEALWEQHLVLFAPMPLSLRKMLEYNKCIIIRNKLLLKEWMNETN